MRSSALILKSLIVFASAMPALAATEIIRSVDRDGRVVFSDRVINDARIVERTPIERINPEDARRAAEQTKSLNDAARAFDARYAERVRRRGIAERDLLAAENRRTVAEQQLVFGEAPYPGETRGIRRGGVRLNEEYWARRALMRSELARAEAAVAEAQARYNAVR